MAGPAAWLPRPNAAATLAGDTVASSQRFMTWPIGMHRDWHRAGAPLPCATFSIREKESLGGSFLAFAETRPQTKAATARNGTSSTTMKVETRHLLRRRLTASLVRPASPGRQRAGAQPWTAHPRIPDAGTFAYSG
jgi:hypothetical protein